VKLGGIFIISRTEVLIPGEGSAKGSLARIGQVTYQPRRTLSNRVRLC